MDSGFRTALIFGSASKHLCQDSKSQTSGPRCDSCDENSSDAFLHLKKGKRDIYIYNERLVHAEASFLVFESN